MDANVDREAEIYCQKMQIRRFITKKIEKLN